MSLPYQGGKKRICKAIYEKIKEIEFNKNTSRNLFVERFSGMCNVGIEALRDGRKVIFSDINPNIGIYWNEIKNGTYTLPEKITQEQYDHLKISDPSFLRTLVGYYSFSSQFYGGFKGKYENETKTTKWLDYQSKKINDIQPLLKESEFFNKDYTFFSNLKGCTFYDDPPYLISQRYNPNKYLMNFDHETYWENVRELSKNNLVFVSENVAPDDFVSIWSKDLFYRIGKLDRSKKVTENLFVYEKYLNLI